MSALNEILESGILEIYVMGVASAEENQQVERLAMEHPEVKEELTRIQLSLEAYAQAHAIEPSSTIKPLVIATIDYLERIKLGEPVKMPPVLSPTSRAEDFSAWLNRADLKAPSQEDDIFVKIIGFTSHATTAIVWIKDVTDDEVHHDEHERFLILEGSCEITVANTVYQLEAGDYFEIPLHEKHRVKVTSAEPCKAILQRLAA